MQWVFSIGVYNRPEYRCLIDDWGLTDCQSRGMQENSVGRSSFCWRSESLRWDAGLALALRLSSEDPRGDYSVTWFALHFEAWKSPSVRMPGFFRLFLSLCFLAFTSPIGCSRHYHISTRLRVKQSQNPARGYRSFYICMYVRVLRLSGRWRRGTTINPWLGRHGFDCSAAGDFGITRSVPAEARWLAFTFTLLQEGWHCSPEDG